MNQPRTRLAAALTAALLTPSMGSAQSYLPSQDTPPPARAAADWWDERGYVAPLVGWTFADKARGVKDGMHAGLAFGRAFSPQWTVEVRGTMEQFDPLLATSNAGRSRNWTLGVDAQWFFQGRQGFEQRRNVQPYLVLGVGAIGDEVAGRSETSAMVNVGIGASWAFSDWGRLVLEGRYRWDDNRGHLGGTRGDFGDWTVSLGLQIPFGPTPALAPAARNAYGATRAPLHTGLPPLPSTTPVPAAPVLVPGPGMPITVPAPASSAHSLAPTPPVYVPGPMAFPSEPDRQAVSRSVDMTSDGMFPVGRAELSSLGRNRIEQLVRGLSASGLTEISEVKVVGHTDPLGSEASNQALSQERARTVKDLLVSLGIPASAITASGMGASQPKVTEADCRAEGARTRSQLATCLAPNRRVEISVTGYRGR
jgi:OOP family OmpA-OmpF porin